MLISSICRGGITLGVLWKRKPANHVAIPRRLGAGSYHGQYKQPHRSVNLRKPKVEGRVPRRPTPLLGLSAPPLFTLDSSFNKPTPGGAVTIAAPAASPRQDRGTVVADIGDQVDPVLRRCRLGSSRPQVNVDG